MGKWPFGSIQSHARGRAVLDPAALANSALREAARDIRRDGVPHLGQWLSELGPIRTPFDTLRALSTFRRGCEMIAAAGQLSGYERRHLGERLRLLEETATLVEAPLPGCQRAVAAVCAAAENLAPSFSREVQKALRGGDWQNLRRELPEFIRTRFALYAQRALRLGVARIEPSLIAFTMGLGRLPPLPDRPSEYFWAPLVPRLPDCILYGPQLFVEDWVHASLVGVVGQGGLLSSLAPVSTSRDVEIAAGGSQVFTLLPRVVGAALSLLGERLARVVEQHAEDLQGDVVRQARWLRQLARDLMVPGRAPQQMRGFRRWNLRLATQEARLTQALQSSVGQVPCGRLPRAEQVTFQD